MLDNNGLCEKTFEKKSYFNSISAKITRPAATPDFCQAQTCSASCYVVEWTVNELRFKIKNSIYLEIEHN